MTPAELLELRSALEGERVRTVGAITSLHGTAQLSEEEGDPGGVGADSATMTFERELGEGLEEGAQQVLAQIERALARLDEGSYGICERCGEPIGDERLRARPSATLCIDDQRRADRG